MKEKGCGRHDGAVKRGKGQEPLLNYGFQQ